MSKETNNDDTPSSFSPDERASLGYASHGDREELLRRMRSFRGRLPADFKFDRDEANLR